MYAYVGDDPVNLTDPAGTMAVAPNTCGGNGQAPCEVTVSLCPDGWTCYRGGFDLGPGVPSGDFDDAVNRGLGGGGGGDGDSTVVVVHGKKRSLTSNIVLVDSRLFCHEECQAARAARAAKEKAKQERKKRNFDAYVKRNKAELWGARFATGGCVLGGVGLAGGAAATVLSGGTLGWAEAIGAGIETSVCGGAWAAYAHIQEEADQAAGDSFDDD